MTSPPLKRTRGPKAFTVFREYCKGNDIIKLLKKKSDIIGKTFFDVFISKPFSLPAIKLFL